MGSSGPSDADRFIERYKEEQERALERYIQESQKRTEEDIRRMPQQYRIYMDNKFDNLYRKNIIQNQRKLGYNLNPYRMTSSELKYWSDRINDEIMAKAGIYY